jgi:hypothetical protein
VLELRGSMQALASELPLLVDTLHSDLRQSVRDLGALAKPNMACTDVAKLCAQVSCNLSMSYPPSQLTTSSTLMARTCIACARHTASGRVCKCLKSLRSSQQDSFCAARFFTRRPLVMRAVLDLSSPMHAHACISLCCSTYHITLHHILCPLTQCMP